MQINIPPAEQQQLAAMAARHGYSSVEEYASTLVMNAVQLEAFAELDSEELDESVRSVSRGIQQSEDGLGVPVKEALQRIADNLGVDFQR